MVANFLRVPVVVLLIMLCTGNSVTTGQQPGVAGVGQQGPPRDILSEYLLPPEFILQNAETIDLQDAQKEKIQTLLDTAQAKNSDVQGNLQKELESLANLLDQDASDEKPIMSQLDNVIRKEREVKRLNMLTMLRIRNVLSETQWKQLQDKKNQIVAARKMQMRIQGKAMQIQQAAQQMQQAGQEPTALVQVLQQFQQKAQAGDVAGAEAVLDQALTQLGAAQNGQVPIAQ